MKKGLVRLLLTNLIFTGIFSLFTSYNSKPYYYNNFIQEITNIGKEKFNKKSEYYLPFEKELRVIEQEKYNEETNDCRHKGLKYYNLLKENGEISHIISGLAPPFKDTHIWLYVLNQETGIWHMVDPTWKSEQDGLPIENYPKKQVHYIFDKNVNMKNIKKKRKCLKKFFGNIIKYNRECRRDKK